MRKISYSGKVEGSAQVVGRNLPISRKIGREIAVFIKGKTATRAIDELKRVADGDLAISYKRFNQDTPHRKGHIMSGRFPKKASLEIAKLIESLKANAEQKALDVDAIKIVHASCQHGTLAWHYGRKRRRRRKLAHFELVGIEVEEEEEKKYGKKAKKVAKKAEKKIPVKKDMAPKAKAVGKKTLKAEKKTKKPKKTASEQLEKEVKPKAKSVSKKKK